VLVHLRIRDEEIEIDLADLEEEVRSGRVPGIAEVRHRPWTGDRFRPIQELDALSELLDAPGARLMAHMRLGPWPWASTLVTLVVLLFGVAQGLATLFGGVLGEAGVVLVLFFREATTGLDAMIFDGRWHTAWTSQLAHAGPRHLLPNLAVVGYAGFRVERALGAGGLLLVAAASVAVGALGIAALEDQPVLGSSVLGYGLWGAMVAIGLRFDELLPPSDRRFYGFGAIVLFAVLLVGSFGQQGISHTGHAAGLLGGIAAAFALRPESTAPRAGVAAQRSTNLVLAALVGLGGPWLGSHLLSWMPAVVLGSPVTVELDGWVLQVPSEMAERTSTVGGTRAFTTSEASREGVFASARDLGERLADGPETTWARRSAGPLEVLAAPEARGPAWVSWRARLTTEEGEPFVEVLEHRLQQGHVQWRLGWLVQVDDAGRLGRRARTFAGILEEAEHVELDAVKKARLAWEAGGGPRTALNQAAQLHALGLYEEADALLAGLAPGTRLASEAIGTRLALWAAHPELTGPDAEAWVVAGLAGLEGDWRLMRRAIRWLLALDACASAGAQLEAVGTVWGDSRAYGELRAEVGTACP